MNIIIVSYFFLILIYLTQSLQQIDCPYKCKACSLDGNQIKRTIKCKECEKGFKLSQDDEFCYSECVDNSYYLDEKNVNSSSNPFNTSQCTSTCTKENYAIDQRSKSCRQIIRCPRIVAQGMNFSGPIKKCN